MASYTCNTLLRGINHFHCLGDGRVVQVSYLYGVGFMLFGEDVTQGVSQETKVHTRCPDV